MLAKTIWKDQVFQLFNVPLMKIHVQKYTYLRSVMGTIISTDNLFTVSVHNYFIGAYNTKC